MRGTDDAEVAAVQRRNLVFVESFSRNDDRRIHGAERKIAVGAHQFGDSKPVLGGDGVSEEASGRDVTEETDLRLGSKPGPEEVHHFCDDQLRDQKRSGVGFKQFEALAVVVVISIDVGVEAGRRRR